MAKGNQKKKQGKGALGDIVQIVGPHKLQNDLLSWFLEKELGVICMKGPDFTPPEPDSHSGDKQRHLVLFDCLDATSLPFWASGVDPKSQNDAPEYFLALLNLNNDRKLTREAMARGIRGVIYEGTPLPILAKGVKNMLSGELWYSRETLTHFLLEPDASSSLPEKIAQALTPREREILTRIASGSSNQEIADDLYISLHTVKSHIYNIYKKIDVPNRLQAALWVAKYL